MNDYNLLALKAQHQLSKIKYAGDIAIYSEMQCELKPFSEYAAEIVLPFEVKGVLIQSNVYADGMLSWEELRKSAGGWEGIRIYKGGHKTYKNLNSGEDDDVTKKVGLITKVYVNEEKKWLEYEAHIYDLDVAYKIYAGLIEFVSIGFYHNWKVIGGKKCKVDLEPREVSLVHNPKCKSASIKPKTE